MFISDDHDLTAVSHIIEEQRCEVVIVKHSRLSELEDALNLGYCPNLRVILFADDDGIPQHEVGLNWRAEETLMQENDLLVISLSHEIETEFANFSNSLHFSSWLETTETIASSPEMRDSPAVIVYDIDTSPVLISHRNLIAAASSLALQYHLTFLPSFLVIPRNEDILVIDPPSLTSSCSLFLAAMMSGARFASTSRLSELCPALNPTIVAANTSAFGALCKQIRSCSCHPVVEWLLTPLRELLFNTPFFKHVCDERVTAILGRNVRLCLSFYVLRPLCKPDYFLLSW